MSNACPRGRPGRALVPDPLRRLREPRRAAGAGGRGSWAAASLGRVAGAVSRLAGGGGSVVAGRLALALDPGVLGWLGRRRTVVLVTGTNGKTTTCHLLAAALGTAGAVAHNASGSNMADGAVAALAARPRARWAVLEVDELHLEEVADAVDPAVIVVLNLSRDQLDRVSEVRTTAARWREVVRAHPGTTAIANADDPLTVWAARDAPHVIWVAAGGSWHGDSASCPQCGEILAHGPRPSHWCCRACGLARPSPRWWWDETGDPRRARVHHTREGSRPGVDVLALELALPGRFNVGNAVMGLAAADAVGVGATAASRAQSAVAEVAGRYLRARIGDHHVRLLLMKNPAGWAEALDILRAPRPLVLVVNAREADGRDVSWLWDLPVAGLRDRAVAVAGERWADLGVRLSYDDVEHTGDPDPLAALRALPPGEVDVVANYTAFLALRRRLRAVRPGRSRALGRAA